MCATHWDDVFFKLSAEQLRYSSNHTLKNFTLERQFLKVPRELLALAKRIY